MDDAQNTQLKQRFNGSVILFHWLWPDLIRKINIEKVLKLHFRPNQRNSLVKSWDRTFLPGLVSSICKQSLLKGRSQLLWSFQSYHSCCFQGQEHVFSIRVEVYSKHVVDQDTEVVMCRSEDLKTGDILTCWRWFFFSAVSEYVSTCICKHWV